MSLRNANALGEVHDRPRWGSPAETQVRTGLSAGGRWIRTLGPALHTHRFGPPLVGSVTVPFAKMEITLSRPGTERSKPASAAECTGQTAWGLSAGALPTSPRMGRSPPIGLRDAAGDVVRARYDRRRHRGIPRSQIPLHGRHRPLINRPRGARRAVSILNPLTRPLAGVGWVERRYCAGDLPSTKLLRR